MTVQSGEGDYVPPKKWLDITPQLFLDEDAPFRVYVNHFKSSQPRTEAFIKDPRQFMQGKDVEGIGEADEALTGVTGETRIQTWITNHENTLRRMILFATAIVENDGSAVSVTLYKHGDGQP